MSNKIIFGFLFAAGLFFIGCAGDGSTETDQNTTEDATTSEPEMEVGVHGIGRFGDMELTHPLDEEMIAEGKTIYEIKCASCHKLSDELIVGPGWAGITDRRTPGWIMNFVTNTEEMLDKDPESQAMLEVCMVRMPNQNLTDEDARAVLEFMRKNDGKS